MNKIKKKDTKIAEAESNAQVIRLMERVEELTEKETVGVNKDIVAFIGPTKAGKSTLANCLSETKLICKINEYTGDAFIFKADDYSGPKIGTSGESETESPECLGNMPETNYEMWDFAGFGDNKGTEQEIVNAISYQTILVAAENVCFVLVAPLSMIKDDDPLPFYKLLNEVHTICPEIDDSLCVVFTKFDRGNIEKLLIRAKCHEFKRTKQENMGIINQGKIIIEKILEKSNYIDFKAPMMDENEEEKDFILPNKQEIVECIKKLKGTKVKDFPLVISDQAKYVIAELFTVFYHKVNNEVRIMNYLTEKYIQTKIDEIQEAKEEDGKSTSAASKLAYFKSGKYTIENILEKSYDFKAYFDEIAKLGMATKGISKSIEKLVFTEKLKNMYKMKDIEISSQAELEFFSNVKVALNSGIKKYSDLILASEAATEEEKNKEIEWKKLNKDEINTLKEQIDNLKGTNVSLQVDLTEKLKELVNQHSEERQKMEKCINEQSTYLKKVQDDLGDLLLEKQKIENEIKKQSAFIEETMKKLENTALEKETIERQLAYEKENKESFKERVASFRKELIEKEEILKQTEASKRDVEEKLEKNKKILEETKEKQRSTEEELKKKWCVISLVTNIDYSNPLLNKPFFLKFFSDLYGTKALSYLISLTEVLSEDSSESLKEICGSPHALEMFATMIGFS